MQTSSTKNILSLDIKPIWVTPKIGYRHIMVGESDIKVIANFTKKTGWCFGAWQLPEKEMIGGAKYTFSYDGFEGEQTQHMLISLDRKRVSDGQRSVIADMMAVDGDKATFVYDTKNFKDYQIKLFVSRHDATAYVGKFSGVFRQLYLAQEGEFSGFVPFAPAGAIEKRIVNNEILDKRREEVINNIFAELEGVEFSPVAIDSIGLGYLELGDRVQVVSNDKYYECPIFNYTLDFSGGAMKERLFTPSPGKTSGNYTRTSSAERHIYNTEIEVDKQKQTITSVVSEQRQQGVKIDENFSTVVQMVNNISQTIRKTGGANLLKNSVGYGREPDGTITGWICADNSKVASEVTPEALNFGAISGSDIVINGTAIRQRVAVAMGEPYTLSCRVFKGLAGVGKIRLSNVTDDLIEVLEDQKAFEWEEKVFVIRPSRNYLDIEFIAEGDTVLKITDVMFAQGDSRRPWQQSSGEIRNVQVNLDESGMRVTNSNHSGDYVNITAQEVAGYSDASGSSKKVFTINRDTTEVEKLEVRTQIDMPPLRIVPVKSGNARGWAFLKSKGGN